MSTVFTRRPIRQMAWPRVSQTNGILVHVGNWHKNAANQQDLDWQCRRLPGRRDNETEWEAIPKIFGELHPQYAGYGPSQPLAKADAAQKIANSGHCVSPIETAHCPLILTICVRSNI
ncbi:hypothetical protein BDV93DRAFT_565056 [Ceratobasidium sp. AG-I]|nr:hypothetical protein BDV93DRAFT_565056 [Ceratobasidium sp. AG-I]